MEELAIVILAAGHGVRMQSRKQKVLHEVGGKPMVQHVFETARAVSRQKPLLVVGSGQNGVQRLLGDGADYVVQEKRLGTGHATSMAAPLLQGKAARVAVTYADMPLLRAETLTRPAHAQAESGVAVAMLTVTGEPGSSFGRVLRNEQGMVTDIVEVAAARQLPNSAGILAIRELNMGVYCFDAAWLWQNLAALPQRQARGGPEQYLTDLVSRAVQQSRQVAAMPVADPDEGLGAGTRSELAQVEKAFRRRANSKWLAAGVTLIDPDTTYIDQDVSIGQDTIIWPNTFLQGNTQIGEGCILGPNAIIRDAKIGRGCRVEQAAVIGATLANGEFMPPFTVRQEESDE